MYLIYICVYAFMYLFTYIYIYICLDVYLFMIKITCFSKGTFFIPCYFLGIWVSDMVCKWVPVAKVKSGNKQYRCGKTMMLTTDMALIEDPKFKDWGGLKTPWHWEHWGKKRGPTRCPSWIGWSSHLTHIGCEDIWFVAIDCKSFVQRVTWTVFLGEAIVCILQSAVVFLATLAQQQVRLPQAGAPECDCGSKATIHLNIIFRGNDRA